MLKDIAKIKVWSGLIVRGFFLFLILYTIYFLNQMGWPVLSALGFLLGLVLVWLIFLMVLAIFRFGIISKLITFGKDTSSAIAVQWTKDRIRLIGANKSIPLENVTICLKTRFLYVDTYHLFFILDGFAGFLRLKFFRGNREKSLPPEKYALLPGSYSSWKYSFWKSSLYFRGIKNRRSKWLNNFVELYLNQESRKYEEKDYQLIGGGILLDWRHMRDSIRAIGIKKFSQADPQRVAQLEMAVKTEWPLARIGISGEDLNYSFCRYVMKIPLNRIQKIYHEKDVICIAHDLDELPQGIIFSAQEKELAKWITVLPQEKIMTMK